MLGSIFVWSANNSHQLKRKKVSNVNSYLTDFADCWTIWNYSVNVRQVLRQEDMDRNWGKFSCTKGFVLVFKIRCILWGWCTVRQVMPKKMPKADGIDHLLILLLVPHQWPEDLDNYLTLSTKSSLGYLKPAFWAIWDPWGHVRHLHEAGGYEGPNEWWLEGRQDSQGLITWHKIFVMGNDIQPRG